MSKSRTIIVFLDANKPKYSKMDQNAWIVKTSRELITISAFIDVMMARYYSRDNATNA